MKHENETETVRIEADRLAQLCTEKERIAGRIQELESNLASRHDQARSVDEVAVALGEIPQPLDATDELHECRGKLAQLVRAIDVQNSRVVAAQAEADRVANEAARPAHMVACRKLADACEAFARAIADEKAVRQSLVAAGHNCHIDPLGEGLTLPEGAVAELRHYVAIQSADSAGEPVRCLALVDLPSHGATCGESVTLNPREFAILHRDGAVDLVATPPASPKRHQCVAPVLE